MSCSTPRNTTAPPDKPYHADANGLLKNVLLSDTFLARYLTDPQYKIQVAFTSIKGKGKKPGLLTHYFQVDPDMYFYPASTVKLPVAILALQRLNELNIVGLNKETAMMTGQAGELLTAVDTDSTSEDHLPSIAQYIKKILLVSDNDAFNRLYEFLGQEYINKTLSKLDLPGIQIIHRLEISLNEEQNRTANAVRFYDRRGNLLYEKPEEVSQYVYEQRDDKLGVGYIAKGQLMDGPFDFSKKNKMILPSLHEIVQRIIYPETFPAEKRFNLTKSDYAFLKKYMSMSPRESDFPKYDEKEYFDSYVRFLYYGSEKDAVMDKDLKIYNKVGDAYGFLTDAAFFENEKEDVRFFLSATIHVNKDGIYNDGKYEYTEIGWPFMKQLGRVIFNAVLDKRL